MRVFTTVSAIGIFVMSCGMEPAQQKSCAFVPPTAQSALNIEDGTETSDYSSTILLVSGTRGGFMTKCTGTIVGHNVVLTALHCMKGEASSVYLIRASRLTSQEISQALQTAIRPKKIISHSGVSATTEPSLEFFAKDFVALIFEDNTFKSSAVTIPSISGVSRPIQFMPSIMVGFGKSSPTDTSNGSIKRVGSGFYLVDPRGARDLITTYNRAVDETTFQPQGPKKFSQTLQGDSGGPLFVKRDNRLDIVGVLSGGGVYPDGITGSSIYVDLYSARSLELMSRAAAEGAVFTKMGEANSNAVEPGQGGGQNPANCIN